jgi:tetratricopeptide (TPR) repeat protein
MHQMFPSRPLRALPLLVLLGACGGPSPPQDLPPLPRVEMDAALPVIRDQVDEALAAAQARPLDPVVNGRLGMVLANYDRFDAALAAYSRARALAPGDYRWPYLQGRLLGFNGRSEEAVSALREALRLRPGDAQIRIALADQLRAAGRPLEVEPLYRAALDANPRLLRAHLGLGRLLAAQGDTGGSAMSTTPWRTCCGAEARPNWRRGTWPCRSATGTARYGTTTRFSPPSANCTGATGPTWSGPGGWWQKAARRRPSRPWVEPWT